MILTPMELLDIVIMTLAVGFIFSDFLARFRRPSEDYDPLKQNYNRFINWDNFKFAALVTAPAIILHEFGHKFIALSFGYNATFHAAYLFLFIGIMLKLMKSPFLFFVPAYVSFSAAATPLQHS